MWPFNTGDYFIDVTTWAGLTVYRSTAGMGRFLQLQSVWFNRLSLQSHPTSFFPRKIQYSNGRVI